VVGEGERESGGRYRARTSDLWGDLTLVLHSSPLFSEFLLIILHFFYHAQEDVEYVDNRRSTSTF